jgi:sirohydrochlorin cobaltochelatase
MKKALLIVGHGSKSKDAVEIFEKIINLVKQKANYEFVFGAHMELAVPSIEKTVAELTKNSVKEIIIIPYFLYEGNHIKFDIPKIIEKLKLDYPDVKFKFGKPIGFEPVLADILIKRAAEAENQK